MINEVNELLPDPAEIALTLNLMLKGRSNATGTVTLTASDTTTTVSDNLFQSDMVPVLVPTTASAASASPYVSSRTLGSFVLTHDSDAATDRTYLYIRLG